MLSRNQTIPAHQARQNFYQLLNRVANQDQIIRIRKRNGQAVVMLPEAELESWLETMEVLSDTQLIKEIHQSEKEIKAGKTVTLDELDEILNLD